MGRKLCMNSDSLKACCKEYCLHSNEDFSEEQNLSCPAQGEFMKNGKRYVRLITHDSVRDLIIPDLQRNFSTGVFTEADMEALSRKPEAIQRKTEDVKPTREEELAKSNLRKRELLSYPTVREFGPRLTKLEIEAEAKANFLSNRAKEIRQEDEDDIKLCNKLILGTKCQAIRDAQVAEKKTLQKELAEEEKRLENMIEHERKRRLSEEEKQKLKALEKKNKYIKDITDQVKGNELEREMEAERLVEEQRLLNDAIMRTRIQELQEIDEKEKMRDKVRNELNRINKSIIKAAEKERKQAKIADLKIQQYMRDKAEQEMLRDAEAAEIRLAREKELAKLRAAQQKAQDNEAAKDEIRAKRIQEEYELQWRIKEKEVAEMKSRRNKQLKADRERQVEERKQWQEAEAARELEEVAKLNMIEQILVEKEKEDKLKRSKELLSYKAALLKQMNEKETERIKARRQLFEEAITTKLENDIKDQCLKNNIRKKISVIRTHNVPERYVEEIERKLKVENIKINANEQVVIEEAE